MSGRSGRGRWERVIAARRQARIAQGRDPDQTDLFTAPPKPRTTQPMPVPSSAPRPSEGIGVMSLGEAAGRLGVSRSELEAMIDAGKVEALPTGFTRMIPTREIVRLTSKENGG